MQSARFKLGDIGVWAALASAFLFGMGTPLAKWLLDQMSPWMLAGLLYLGLGLGSGIYRLLCGFVSPRLNASEMRWLAAAVVCGGGMQRWYCTCAVNVWAIVHAIKSGRLAAQCRGGSDDLAGLGGI